MHDCRILWRLRHVIGIAIITAGVCLQAFADEGAGSPQSDRPSTAAIRGPSVEAVHVDTAPVIDGQLDDSCWAEAARFEGLYCSQWNAPAPEETIGLVCADGDAIYIAVICNDSSPQDIVANETRRNGDLSEDDCIRIWLDATHQRNYYVFDVNARGTQAEDIPGGSATKIEWRGDWTAAAARTDAGWQAEVAIPFSILRYPRNQTTFAFAVARQFARERVRGVWPNMGPADDLTLCADLVGLRPPTKARRPVLMPYLTLEGGDTQDRGVDAGLDVQQKLPTGLTVLGAFNPDFKQIEDVVEPISFSYTERYLRDPRPFFVTGQSDFLPREHLLYTRRIQDFDAGLKLFGTVGKDIIGVLDAIAFGEQNAFAASWKHNFNDDNWTRLAAVSHQADGQPDNLASELAAGRTWRCPGGNDSVWMVLYNSQTQGAGTGSSYALGGSHFRGFGRIVYDWMVRRATPDFRPALGYYPDIDNAGGEINIQQVDFYEKGSVEARQWMLNIQYYPYLERDGMYSSSFSPGYALRTRSGRLYVLVLDRGRRYDYDNSHIMALHAWNDADLYRRGEITFLRGKAAGGDLTYYKLDQGLRPMESLSLRASAEYVHLAMPDGSATHQYQAVLTTSYDITPEKCIAARGIWRDAGFSAYASYRQVVRRGMDAYLIVGDPDPAKTGFTNRAVLKLIWTF